MTEELTEEQLKNLAINEDDEATSKYKAPAEKSIAELQNLDADDEALQRYKESLLGAVSGGQTGDARRVVVRKIELHSPELSAPLELDLTVGPDELKKQSFKIKEGADYHLTFFFKVNNEIVSGLRFNQVVKRKGIAVDKIDVMVGSYAPKADDYTYKTDLDEAPSGMLARGTYKVKSKFIDDDKKEHAVWEWQFEITKKWD